MFRRTQEQQQVLLSKYPAHYSKTCGGVFGTGHGKTFRPDLYGMNSDNPSVAATWRTMDGGRFFVSESATGPNGPPQGDYTPGCWLRCNVASSAVLERNKTM